MNKQNNSEKLYFSIGLSGTFWNKRPEFSILVNGIEYLSGTIATDTGQVELYEFSAEVPINQDNILSIRFLNKDDTDVVKDPPSEEPYKIVQDMLLNINSIEINQFDLGSLLWTHSEFVSDESNRPTLAGCVNLGWNGSYNLNFSTPVHAWLLESLS